MRRRDPTDIKIMSAATMSRSHCYRSMDELNKVAFNCPDVGIKTADNLVKTLERMLLESKTHEIEGNLEKAYILSVRICSVYSQHLSSKALSSEKERAKRLLAATVKQEINRAEGLKIKLKKLYEDLEALKMADEKAASIPEKKASAEVESVPSSGWITSLELYRLMKAASDSCYLLILDVRSEDEFANCHIQFSSIVNIPPNVWRIGYSISAIDKSLQSNEMATSLWNSRGKFKHIVLLDWNSSNKDVDFNAEKSFHPLHHLMSAMIKWDSKKLVKQPIFIVTNGLEDFKLRFPTCVTQPDYKRPSRMTEENDKNKLPTYEMPAEEVEENIENTSPVNGMEEVNESNDTPTLPVVTPTSIIPDIDRSTKPHPVEAVVKLPKILHEQVPQIDSPKPPIPAVSKIPPIDSPRPHPPTPHRFSKEAPASINSFHTPSLTPSVKDTSTLRSMKTDPVPPMVIPKLTPSKQFQPIVVSGAEEWQKIHDPSTNRYRYFNKITGQSTFFPPEQIFSYKPVPPIILKETKPPAQEMNKVRLLPKPAVIPEPPLGSLKRTSSHPALNHLDKPAATVEEEEENSEEETAVPQVEKVVNPAAAAAAAPPHVIRTNKPKMETPRPVSSNDIIIQTLNANQIRSMDPNYGHPGMGLTGLRNLGNTCYMNSVLQALSNTLLFKPYFLGKMYLKDINTSNPLGHSGKMARSFATLIEAIWCNCYKEISPREFKSFVDNSGYIFSGNDQQDSQEFLLFVLDGLHEDLNQIRQRPKLVALDENKINDMADVDHGALSWQRYKSLNKSIIVDNFQGQFKSTVTCCSCGKRSVTFDAFMYLSLPIARRDQCTLKECLEMFLQEEKMTGESMWRCPVCKVNRPAIKKIDLWKLPPYLIVHLKRFSCSVNFQQKLNTAVNYPVTSLDLRGYVKTPSVAEYQLYAVSNHYGRMEGGHYTAYCRNPLTNCWHLFDDNVVTEATPRDVVAPKKVTKLMKREMFIDEKIARNKEKRKARKDRDKNGIEKGVPHTLETLRIADPTISGTETLEWQRTISQDEFENIYSGEKIPKILITLSLDASPPSLGFCKELAQTFPNTFFLPRRKLGLVEDILPNAIAQEYSAVMVFNENQKRLNRLLVCHLPNGPTAEFKVFSAKRRQDLRNRSAKIGSQRLAERTPIERVIPGVYMGRFQTAIGKRVSRILEALFPVPQCDAVTASPHNRLVTFFNMRDYVFFRSHRYELKERIVPLSKTEDGKVKSKKSVKKVALRELGPRFTLKIVSVRKGVFGKSLDYYEWLRDKRVMEASRRQFNV